MNKYRKLLPTVLFDIREYLEIQVFEISELTAIFLITNTNDLC